MTPIQRIPSNAFSKEEFNTLSKILMDAGVTFGIEKNSEGKIENLVIF
jgi:hypothetical protein